MTEDLFEGCNTLEELVYQGVGASSMCWEHVERAGTFDEEGANLIAEALLFKIRGWMNDIKETVMDAPGSLPETVKAEDKRLRDAE